MPNLETELSALLNRYNADTQSNTPDYVLAKFLTGVLYVFSVSMEERERHKGVQTDCGKISLHDVANHDRNKP